jgi:hypothetical protein
MNLSKRARRQVLRSTRKKWKVQILAGVYDCRIEKSTGKWGSGIETEKEFNCISMDILARK